MKTENTVAVPTLEQTVERMKREVLADVANGRVPASVASFGGLHDYVDANECGGFCEDELADAMIAHFGGHDADEGMPAAFVAQRGVSLPNGRVSTGTTNVPFA